jgi:preprotein translocase subunit SecE
MDKIRSFLHGVKKEVERVRWPDRKNLIKDSMAVLTFCIFFGIFFYVINVIVILAKEVFS